MYNNFRNDVLNFRSLLEALNHALQSAQDRYRQQGHQLTTRAYDPLSPDFDKERQLIVGNFKATLQECQKLLDRNRELRRRHSNVWDNLAWHLTQQNQHVDDLRSRLVLHSEKIRLVIDRLVVNLLTDQDATLNDVLGMSEQNLELTNEVLIELRRFRSNLFDHLLGLGTLDVATPEDEHVVSVQISRRLEKHLHIDAPSDLDSGVPVTPAFDALFCTMLSFNKNIDGKDQTPESYLLFLKARWLLDCIKASSEYQSCRPGFYYKRAVNQISRAILARMRRPGELIRYSEDVLMALPDTLYRIWPSESPPQPVVIHRPHPLMVRTNEDQLLRLELAQGERSEADVVTIFRSSKERFRIVLEQTLPSMSNARELIAQIVLTNEDKLIPRFGVPSLATSALELAIFSRGEDTFYHFESAEDMNKFQAALMGYDVSHNQADIICQFDQSVRFLDCEDAQIQLWQDPISLPQPPATSSDESSSTGSQSRHDSLLTSSTRRTTIIETETGWEAHKPKFSAFVIFTQLENRFAVIFIELGRHMRIDPHKCNCWRDYAKCSKIVMTRKDGADFKVRIVYSNTSPDGEPDLNSLDLFQLRLPRHPNFQTLQMKKTKFVLLKFKSLEAKTLFRDELDLRFSIRDAQLREQRDFENHMLYLQDQPGLVGLSLAQSSSQSS